MDRVQALLAAGADPAALDGLVFINRLITIDFLGTEPAGLCNHGLPGLAAD